MTIKTILNAEQGSQEWHDLRCGILTASTVKNIITPKTREIAKGFTETLFFRKKLLERITGIISDACDTVEPYKSDAMLDGHSDEDWALKNYTDTVEPIERVGFVLLDDVKSKYKIGFSPDAITEEYFIEVKSRAPHLHIETLLTGEVPDEFLAQIQAGLLVTGFDYANFISWPRMSQELIEKHPMPAIVIKVCRDEEYIEKIKEAAIIFEQKITEKAKEYSQMVLDSNNFYSQNCFLMPAVKEYTCEIMVGA